MYHVSLFLASAANNEATNKPKENTPRSIIIYYSHQYLQKIYASRAADWPPSSLCWDPCEFHKQPQTVTQSQLVLGSRSGNRISRSSLRWSLSQEHAQTPMAALAGTQGWCTPLSHRGSCWDFIHTGPTPGCYPGCQQTGGCTSVKAEPFKKVLNEKTAYL